MKGQRLLRHLVTLTCLADAGTSKNDNFAHIVFIDGLTSTSAPIWPWPPIAHYIDAVNGHLGPRDIRNHKHTKKINSPNPKNISFHCIRQFISVDDVNFGSALWTPRRIIPLNAVSVRRPFYPPSPPHFLHTGGRCGRALSVQLFNPDSHVLRQFLPPEPRAACVSCL